VKRPSASLEAANCGDLFIHGAATGDAGLPDNCRSIKVR
jgi:hypothetical protein